MSLSEITEQLEKYQGFLENDPENIRLACDTAELFARLGQFNEARRIIRHSLEIHPNEAWLRFRLAAIYLKEENPTLARAILEELIEIGIDNASVRVMYAQALYMQNELIRAEEILLPIAEGFKRDDYPQAVDLLSLIRHHNS